MRILHTGLLVLSLLTAAAIPAAAATSASAETDEGLIQQLVVANHILAQQGVLDAFGHISVRSASNPHHYYMSVSRAPALVTRADIIEFDENSAPVKPESRDLYSERFIHGEIFRARADVNAVIHSHSPAVLPFGLTHVPFQAVIHVAFFLGAEPAPIFDIRDAEGDDNRMLVNNAKSGAVLAHTLGNRTVVLMRGHGMAVAAATIRDAVFRAIYTQVNAQVETATLALGQPVYMNRFEVTRSDRLDRSWELWTHEAEMSTR